MNKNVLIRLVRRERWYVLHLIDNQYLSYCSSQDTFSVSLRLA